MVLFLLPLLFNPFGFAFSWLPFLYLSTWPLIVQTSGRESLMSHALILMLFVLTCDATRRLMLKLIGFDLISLPAGLALLVALATDKGSTFLSMIRPLYGGLLTVIEPVFLLLEMYVFLDMLRNFNRWISKLANVRDEESQDLSQWEPPLTRGSIIMRAVVILLTLFSYVGVYIVIQESKNLLVSDGASEEMPLTFNHAIAALVTLQLIAVSLTIYKEDGILSESAMVALLASVPIFVASLSYYHAKETHLSSSAFQWSSYFPFSLFATPAYHTQATATAAAAAASNQDHSGASLDSNFYALDGGGGGGFFGDSLGSRRLDFNQVESSLDGLLLLDGQSRQLLAAPLKQLIMIINSILGLSVDKIAKYYFSLDFWYILAGRALCIGCWTLRMARRPSAAAGRSHFFPLAAAAAASSQADRALLSSPPSRTNDQPIDLRSLVSRTTIVKLLLILAYSQMLIQQMDNQLHLAQDLEASGASQPAATAAHSGCCHSAAAVHESPSGQVQQGDAGGGGDSSLAGWFNCLWTSAQACSGGGSQTAGSSSSSKATIADGIRRISATGVDFASKLLDWLLQLGPALIQRLAQLRLFGHSVAVVWLARWRSPIVHRLIQSMLVQAAYIGSLALANHDDDDDYDYDYQ